MDKGGQQIIFSNDILNAGAVKSECKIGYSEMFGRSSCACMSIKNTKNEFNELPDCKGLCEKKSVNIYIQSYDTSTNNDGNNLICDLGNVNNYPYFNTVKTESKLSAINSLTTSPNLPKNKPLYSEVMWEESLRNIDTARNWESVKSSSNANFVSRRQFIEERTSYIMGQKGNKPPIKKVQANVSSRDENLFHNRINKYVCKRNGENDLIVGDHSNQIADFRSPEYIASPTCNNLYVAPPYFTVDKFVNQERVTSTLNTPNSISYCPNVNDNQMVHSNTGFGRNVSGITSVQGVGSIFLSKADNRIGTERVENPIVSSLRIEPSIQSNGVNHRQQHCYLPFESEVFKCQNEHISAKNNSFKRRKYNSAEYRCIEDKNIQTDGVQTGSNQIAFSINQCRLPKSIQVENQKLCDFGDTCIRSSFNNIVCQDYLTHMQIQGNVTNETCSRKTSPNCLSSSTKNIIRETRKPNYRELINHVHALRSAQSEDDLNMQIIKRTLNYKPYAKEFLGPKTHKIITEIKDDMFSKKQNISIQTISSNPKREQKLFGSAANIPSPLDLSVKTIKNNADSTENTVNNKELIKEKRFIPTFNFRPDFSDSRNAIPNVGSITNKITVPSSSEKNNQVNEKASSTVETIFKVNSNKSSCSQYSTRAEKVENECIVQESTLCDLDNGMLSCNIKGGHQADPIKAELTMKQPIPFEKGNNSELSHKMNLVESFHRSDSTYSESNNMYAENPNIAIEKPSFTESFNEVGNKMNFTASGYKNDCTTQHLRTNLKTKPSSSSIIAARIRTKGELKGFVFEEDLRNHRHKLLSNKENLNCNFETQMSERIDEVDLHEWGNVCNDFVDQLKNNCSEVNESKLDNESSLLQKNTIDFKISLLNSCNKSNSVENSNNFALIKNTIKIEEVSDENKSNPLSLKQIASASLPENVMAKSLSNIVQHNANLINVGFEINSVDCLKGKEGDAGSYQHSDLTNLERAQFCSKNTENVNKKHIGGVKRTKISVVRLKREQYGTNLYVPCDNNGKINSTSKAKSYSNGRNPNNDNTPRKFSIVTKTTLRRKNTHLDCLQKKQPMVIANNMKSETTCNSIITRMRYQRQQIEKKAGSVKKNKKRIKTLLHRHENSKKGSNEDDKIYLELYKFKRALKIPPNLITIKNTSTDRMSASLPDLDLDIQMASLNNKADADSDCKKSNSPKSIIDVLHSRVVKKKNGFKCSQKHLKSSQNHNSKLALPKFNGTELNIEPLNRDTNIHTCREHRNVFETKVLASRTRMEYKMQLNKEVIREIFGDTARPASAPPEINSNNISYEHGSKNIFCESLQLEDIDLEKKFINEHDKNLRKFIQENLSNPNNTINTKKHEQMENSELSSVSIKNKRKRTGRPYRRKFSSGFDYLRKRKKSNTHAIYKYPRLSFIAETSFKFKSEEDVARELQKWVLNKGVGESALHKAARLGYIDVIVYCLEKMGLNPDHKDNAGYTPLHDACVNGSLEIAKVLLQYGANHSEGAHSGIRPLHEASENGHIEIVRILLSYGADPLLQTYSGQTPLMLASDPEMNDFISLHLRDIQVNATVTSWRFSGPWKIFDSTEEGLDIFNGVSLPDRLYHLDGRKFVSLDGTNMINIRNRSLKNDTADFEIFVDALNAEGDLFEFEEANMPLPPLYLLKDEGSEKWVLLSDLCSLLKVKSKDTLLHKIFPSIAPAMVSRAFVRELKMCDFLEKATCLQLLCAGEKINICHSKVVLVQYNESVRQLLGVNTILMKF